ncbi:hypothetical protein FNV43_RR13497 [Rhamnella rubrinervis]|uniref:Uncharacterized protein n=1 Tax=Rhamnella rubrinervis TaxID=2594499 RepID=A0A8K0H160_9ROSA|nr:hypothetical protein FNV43_RR13497 [Rhamnella rubrinervis]
MPSQFGRTWEGTCKEMQRSTTFYCISLKSSWRKMRWKKTPSRSCFLIGTPSRSWQDLEGILKIKIPKARLQPHEVKVVAGEFSQLQVLKLRNLIIKTLEMEKDTMPNLESLFIDSCDLEYLPEDDLLCRSTLQLVELIGWKVQDKLKTMLTYFKIKHPDTPCKINFTER